MATASTAPTFNSLLSNVNPTGATAPVTSTSYEDASTPTLTAPSVPTTKAAPAVVTTAPAVAKINQAKTTLNDQTAAMQNQAANNAQVKIAADAAAQQKAQQDQTNKLLSATTTPNYPTNPNTGLPQYGTGPTGISGVTPDTNGNFSGTDKNGNAVIFDSNGNIVSGGQTNGQNANVSGGTGANTGNDYNSQLSSLNSQADQAYSDFQNNISKLQNGTFALTPDQQAQITGLQSRFDALKEQQQTANANYTGGVNQAGISSGLERYSPVIQLGQVQASINSGIAKIAQIDSQAASAISQLRQGFLDNDFKMVDAAYTAFSDLQKEKTAQIQHLSDQAQQHSEFLDNYNQKASEDKNQQAYQTFQESMDNANLSLAQKKSALDQFTSLANVQGYYYTDKNGNTTDANGDPISADTPGAVKVDTQAAKQAAVDNYYKAQDLALRRAQQAIDAQAKINPLGVNTTSPQNVKDMVTQGIFSQTGSGQTYLDLSQFSDAATKKQAESIARQSGVPVISNAQELQGLHSIDSGTSNLQTVLNTFKQIAPTNPSEKFTDVLSQWASYGADTPQGQALKQYNALVGIALPGIVKDTTGLNRVNTTELDSAAYSLPSLNTKSADTWQDALGKIGAVQSVLNNNRTALLGNKQVYTDLGSFVTSNPNPTGAQQYIDKVRSQFPTWSPDDVLQYIYSQQSSNQ